MARARRYRSARAAAMQLGIPIATYGAHERAELPGGRDYGPDQAQRYARYFGTTPEWLLTGMRRANHAQMEAKLAPLISDAPDPSHATYPILGYIGAGAEAHCYDVPREKLDRVQIPFGTLPPSTVAFEIRDSNVGGSFYRSLLFFEYNRPPVSLELLGVVCAVGLQRGRIFVRELRKGQKEGLFDLTSPNTPPLRSVKAEWATPILALLPKHMLTIDQSDNYQI
jgi:hypothetical protein